jgi:hypothetical protein
MFVPFFGCTSINDFKVFNHSFSITNSLSETVSMNKIIIALVAVFAIAFTSTVSFAADAKADKKEMKKDMKDMKKDKKDAKADKKDAKKDAKKDKKDAKADKKDAKKDMKDMKKDKKDAKKAPKADTKK